MNPQETSALLGYSCEDFPFQNHPKLLNIERKKGQIPDLKFYKTYVCEEDQHAKLC